jgi:hypothetical protein
MTLGSHSPIASKWHEDTTPRRLAGEVSDVFLASRASVFTGRMIQRMRSEASALGFC